MELLSPFILFKSISPLIENSSKLPSKLLSSYKELITFVNDRPGHDFRYAIDSTKIHENLKWKPKFNFRDALEKTVDWYLNNQDWWETIIKNKYDLDRLGEL